MFCVTSGGVVHTHQPVVGLGGDKGRAGALTPTRKEVKEFTAPGRYTLQVQTMVNGEWKVTEKREGVDPR